MTIKKGQVLNPKGRGARKPVTDCIRAVLSRDADDLLRDKPKTIAQKIALNLVKQAIDDNNLPAVKELIDRVEGKPAQAIVGDKDEDAVQVEIKDTDKSIIQRYLKEQKLDRSTD